ncbi:MAG: fasciclin domain-containing protein [Rhodothermales bacterium]|nr:fasciclin domain-containing protein [Rhodothermales bacterium]
MIKRIGFLLATAVFVFAGCSDTIVNEDLQQSQGALTGLEQANGEKKKDKIKRAAGLQTMTVVETALAVNAETGEFSTLIAALVAADLVDTLDSYGQVTVFAPTDSAFADIGLDATSVDDLPTDALTNILLYHLKTGRQFSGPVLAKKKIRMVNGGFTHPDASIPALVDANGGIAIFASTDVPASNGVIHVIKSVLMP